MADYYGGKPPFSEDFNMYPQEASMTMFDCILKWLTRDCGIFTAAC